MSKTLPAPRMLTKAQAAAYCGIGVQAFVSICPVPATVLREGPNPIIRWDMRRLDQWLDRIGGAAPLTDDDWLEKLRNSRPKPKIVL